MHYYDFNVAEYRRDTAHLTPMEHYIYRTLIDWYYLDEKPIPSDIALVTRKLCLPNDRSTDVQQVLNEFFVPCNETFIHPRIEVDIQAYKRRIDDASKAGIASAAARQAKKDAILERALNGRTTTVQPTSNKEQVTSNKEQETIGSNPEQSSKPKAVVASEKKARAARLPAEWVLPKHWGEWALQEKPSWDADQVRKVALMFKNHWLSTGKNAAKLDWFLTWQNWVMKEPDSPRGTVKQSSPQTNAERIAEYNKKVADEFLGGDAKIIEGEVLNAESR